MFGSCIALLALCLIVGVLLLSGGEGSRPGMTNAPKNTGWALGVGLAGIAALIYFAINTGGGR